MPDTCNKISLKEAERSRLAQSDVYELSTQRWQRALCYSVSSMIIFVSSSLQLIKASWLFCRGLEMNCPCSPVPPCPYLWIILSIKKPWKQPGLFSETFLREAWQKWNNVSMYTAYIVNSSHQKINHCENLTYFSTEKEVRHWLICKGDFTADLI